MQNKYKIHKILKLKKKNYIVGHFSGALSHKHKQEKIASKFMSMNIGTTIKM